MFFFQLFPFYKLIGIFLIFFGNISLFLLLPDKYVSHFIVFVFGFAVPLTNVIFVCLPEILIIRTKLKNPGTAKRFTDLL